MHIHADMNLITISDAADYLRFGERKIYELVANNEISCSKVTGQRLSRGMSSTAGFFRVDTADGDGSLVHRRSSAVAGTILRYGDCANLDLVWSR